MHKIQERIKNIIKVFRTSNSLKARASRGGMWLGFGSGAEQAFRLIRNIILVRLILPEAFGLMAIVLAVNTLFEALTEVGIREAIIQNPKGDEDIYLYGAWWFAFGRSIILYIIAFVCAPFIVRFYNNPELLPMMRIAFLSILFKGLMSAKAYVRIKKMEFKQWIMIEQTGGIIGVLTAIVLAFIIRNVWALVIGFIVESMVRFFLSYIVCPFIPYFNFKKEYLKSLFKFARGMIGLPLLTFIFMKIDIFVIGKLCTSEELGLYSMVVALSNIPSLFMGKFIMPILMPVFSEIQNDNIRINKSILNINSVAAFIGIPMITFTIVYSKSLLSIIYTPLYAQVAIPFAVLFIAQMMRNFNRPIVSLYLALGRPELLRILTSLRALLIVILIYPAVKFYGLIGGATAVLISMCFAYLLQIIQIRKITRLNIKEYFIVFFRAICISIIIIIIWSITHFLFVSRPIIDIFVGTIGLILTYFFSIVILTNKRGNQRG